MNQFGRAFAVSALRTTVAMGSIHAQDASIGNLKPDDKKAQATRGPDVPLH